MLFVLLRPIFCEKWKIAPPFENSPPQTSEFAKLDEIAASTLAKTLFFFWRSPDFGVKKVFNFGFRPKNHSQLWRRPFFFFFRRSPNFGRKKALNFRAFRDISPQVSDKPSEIDSRSTKIRVKVVCTLLTLSK